MHPSPVSYDRTGHEMRPMSRVHLTISSWWAVTPLKNTVQNFRHDTARTTSPVTVTHRHAPPRTLLRVLPSLLICYYYYYYYQVGLLLTTVTCRKQSLTACHGVNPLSCQCEDYFMQAVNSWVNVFKWFTSSFWSRNAVGRQTLPLSMARSTRKMQAVGVMNSNESEPATITPSFTAIRHLSNCY